MNLYNVRKVVFKSLSDDLKGISSLLFRHKILEFTFKAHIECKDAETFKNSNKKLR